MCHLIGQPDTKRPHAITESVDAVEVLDRKRPPGVKPLETFDFGYQPSFDKKQAQSLATCHFIEHGDNVLVLGPPGVGKTHLAVALGLKAIEAGDRVLFSTATHLIAILTQAHAEGRLDEKLKFYTTPRLPSR